MSKKSLIIVSLIFFILFICSGFVFATDNVKSGVSNVTNSVVDGVNRLGSDVRGGIGNAENSIEGAVSMDNNVNMNNDIAGNYNATRTTADATTGTLNTTSNMWIWLVFAIAAIVIIVLVWYYGAQNTTTHHDE